MLCSRQNQPERNQAMPKCMQCNDTGVIETGNNDIPCDCPAGNSALFNTTGVDGSVTGAELRRHFWPDSPEPISTGTSRGSDRIQASSLPGRINE